ncbi:MAG: fumarate hydratase C-terminal domain-containing protein, partial [Candidatus Rokuibacteriota bacterium]
MITTASDGVKEVVPPLSDADVESLKAGDRVRITGVLYTARDAAHGRLLPLMDAGKPLPIDVRGQIIYYTGPSPARPGQVAGSIGPTTGGRMDTFTPK